VGVGVVVAVVGGIDGDDDVCGGADVAALGSGAGAGSALLHPATAKPTTSAA